MDKKKSSKLHTNVAPFIPKQYPTVHRDPTSIQVNTSTLSANVAEFVPSWLQPEKIITSSQKSYFNHAKITDHGPSSPSKPSFTKKKINVEKSNNHTSLPVSQPSPTTDNLKNSSSPNIEKNTSSPKVKTKPNRGFVSNKKESSTSDHQNNVVDSEFPALSSATKHGEWPLGNDSNYVGRTQNFAISFSEKLKSSNWNNANGYSANTSAVSVQKASAISTKHERDNKQNSKKNVQKGPAENDRVVNSLEMQSKVSKQEGKLYADVKHVECGTQPEDRGFHVVKNKAKTKAYEKNQRNGGGNQNDEMGQTKAKTSSQAVDLDDNKKGEKRFEDRVKNTNRYNTKRFSENRNAGTLGDAAGQRGALGDTGGQWGTRGGRSSKNGYSSDPDWRKKRERLRDVRMEDGKEQGDIRHEKITKAERIGKHEESELSDYPKLGSTRERHGGTPAKPRVENRHSETRVENSGGNPANTKREQLKIKITLGKVNGDNTPAADTRTRAQFSYSDALKCKAKVQLPDPPVAEEKERGILRIPNGGEVDQQQEEGSDPETKTKKKKKKKKKSSETPQAVKKTKEPLLFDFGNMLTKLEETSNKKKQVIRESYSSLLKKSKETVSNTLDSTAPIVFRGKEREIEKRKNPSTMRKMLNKEREERKLLHDEKPLADATMSNEDGDEECEYGGDDEDSEKPTSTFPDEIKKSIHSRKFREYCDHDLHYDINGIVIALLKELIRFQDRLYLKDPVKAKAKRRFVCGLREVFKHAKLKRLKCVIVTPNLEPTKCKGGLNDLLSKIIDVCHSHNVPVVFALNRQILGKVLLKKVPVSVVGIFYYDGAQNYFKNLMEQTKVARETYQEKFETARQTFLAEKKREEDENEVSDGHENVKQEVNTSENERTDQSCDEGEKGVAASEIDVFIRELETTELAMITSCTSRKAELTEQYSDVTVQKEEPLLANTAVSCNTKTVVSVSENEEKHIPDVDEISENVVLESSFEAEDYVNDSTDSINEDLVEPCMVDERIYGNTETVLSVCEIEESGIRDVADAEADHELESSSDVENDYVVDGEDSMKEEPVEPFFADESPSGNMEGENEVIENEVEAEAEEHNLDKISENMVLTCSSEVEKGYVNGREDSIEEELVEPFLADERASGNMEGENEVIENEVEAEAEEHNLDKISENMVLTCSSEVEKGYVNGREDSIEEELVEPFLADERASCNMERENEVTENEVEADTEGEHDLDKISENLVLTCSSELDKDYMYVKDREDSVKEELVEPFLAIEKKCNMETAVSSLCENEENRIPDEAHAKAYHVSEIPENATFQSSFETEIDYVTKDGEDSVKEGVTVEQLAGERVSCNTRTVVAPVCALKESHIPDKVVPK